MQMAPTQMNGYSPSFGNTETKTYNDQKSIFNDSVTSELTSDEQDLLNSFRKDSTDDRWDYDDDDHDLLRDDLRPSSRQEDSDEGALDLDAYGYTDDQRQALRELDNMRLDLGYVEEDPPEYDVAERVRLLNAELEQEPEPDENRTRSIHFKDDLISLVAPPPDYSSFEDSDEGDTKRSNTPDKADSEESNAPQKLGSSDSEEVVNDPENKDAIIPTSDSSDLNSNTNSNEKGKSSPEPEMDYGQDDYENDFEDSSPSDRDTPSRISPTEQRLNSEHRESDTPSPKSPRSPRSPSPSSRENSDISSDKIANTKSDNSEISDSNSSNNLIPNGNSTAQVSDTGDSKEQSGKDKEKVLIERNGKFELVSVEELKAQGLYHLIDSADTTDGETNDTESGTSKTGTGSDEEKVLIERNGKFEMVTAAELKAQGLYPFPELADEVAAEDLQFQQPTPPRGPRPATAAASSNHRRGMSAAPRRAQSAKHGSAYEGSGKGLYDEFNYISPYALTPEQKKEMRQKHREEMKDNETKTKEQQREDERKQRDCNDAFQYWLKTKKKDASSRKKEETKQTEEEKTSEEERRKNREEAGAFTEWLKIKKKQKKQETFVEETKNKELNDSWSIRPRTECDKAYKQWLKKKGQDTRKEQRDSRNKQRINKLLTRRSRKAMALARALRQSASFKYVDYYGYRY